MVGVSLHSSFSASTTWRIALAETHVGQHFTERSRLAWLLRVGLTFGAVSSPSSPSESWAFDCAGWGNGLSRKNL